MKNTAMIGLCLLWLTVAVHAQPGTLTRAVRLKISAGDLVTGAALAEDYKSKTGVDAEYLDTIGWLARGAEMLKQYDLAAQYVAELHREIKEEKPELLGPYGAAIEVEGRLLLAREGRGAALRYWEQELTRAKNVALRSRIYKNLNLFSLEGQTAPEISLTEYAGPLPAPLTTHKGKPVLLYFWAHWCGDCRAQASSLVRIYQKFKTQGLVLVAPTRFYGTGAEGKNATPNEEKAHLTKVWAETYAGLEGITIPIDIETMVRYGVSATPTFVLIDRQGKVRSYAATRLSEAELARRIEALLAETP